MAENPQAAEPPQQAAPAPTEQNGPQQNGSNGPKKCLIRFGNMLIGNKFIGNQPQASRANRNSNKAPTNNGTQSHHATLANNNNQQSGSSTQHSSASAAQIAEANSVFVRKQSYFLDCHRAYSCIHCGAHLANHDELISKLFQGNHGRAYLFNKVTNIGCKQAVQRELLTGLHAVADIYCDNCETTVGWKYEQAFVPSQKYKEGKYIIELVHILKENNWDLTSYNVKALLDEAQLAMMKAAKEEETRLSEFEQQKRLKYNYNQYNRNKYYYKRHDNYHNRASGLNQQPTTSTRGCNFNRYSSTSCMDFHSDDNKAILGDTTNTLSADATNTSHASQSKTVATQLDVCFKSGEANTSDALVTNQAIANSNCDASSSNHIAKVESMIELKVCNNLNQNVEREANVVCGDNETTTILLVGASGSNSNNCTHSNNNNNNIHSDSNISNSKSGNSSSQV